LLGDKRLGNQPRALAGEVNLIVSGRVGIGKTTVCEKVLALAREGGLRCGGILTLKIASGSTIAGIAIIDIQTWQKETLASVDNIYDGPRIGRYYFNPAGIEFGRRAIKNGAKSDVLFVDEIGYLELRGEGFTCAPALVKAGKVANSILVIRRELLPDFQTQFNKALPVFEVNLDNREVLPGRIYQLLAKPESA